MGIRQALTMLLDDLADPCDRPGPRMRLTLSDGASLAALGAHVPRGRRRSRVSAADVDHMLVGRRATHSKYTVVELLAADGDAGRFIVNKEHRWERT